MPRRSSFRARLPLAGMTAGLCLGAGVAPSDAQPPLTLWNAVEISHPTEPGKTYTVQGTDNLSAWTPLHSPLYGDGGAVRRLLSTRTVPVDYQFYRLKIDTAPDGGLAPWSLAGKSFLRSSGGVSVKYVFAAGGQVTRTASSGAAATAQWTWLRTGPDTGRATLRRMGAADEILELTYAAAGVGMALREQRIGWGAATREAGSFGPVPAAGEPMLPRDGLEGLNLAMADASGVLGLRFTGPGRGELVSAGAATPFTCAWAAVGNAGEVSVTVAPDRQESYRLTFSGPCAGTFERRVYQAGVLGDVDSGAFSFGKP